MKLYGNGIVLNNLATAMALEKSRGEAAATLSVTLLKAAADRFMPKESIAVGDAVRLLDDSGGEVFAGTVEEITRTGETVRLIACDGGIFLTKNEVCGVFAGAPEDICRAVAGKIGLAVGTIDAPTGYKSLVIRSGVSAFSVLRQAVGEDREISVKGGKLAIARVGETVHTVAPEAVLSSAAEASVTQMVNACTVIGRNGSTAASAQNDAQIARYGLRRQVLGKSGDAQAQASAALAGMRMCGNVTLRGALRYRCGDKIAIHKSEWGMDGTFAVTAVKHEWRRGAFTSEVGWEK